MRYPSLLTSLADTEAAALVLTRLNEIARCSEFASLARRLSDVSVALQREAPAAQGPGPTTAQLGTVNSALLAMLKLMRLGILRLEEADAMRAISAVGE